MRFVLFIGMLLGFVQFALCVEQESLVLTTQQIESLVIIEGDSGGGSGAICQINGAFFVVTNAHVIAGQSDLTVSTVNGGLVDVDINSIWLAVGHDVAIMRIEEPRDYLNIADFQEDEIKIDDNILVPGNERGAGVVTKTEGQILGMGPKLIEVDARFVQGNSGSPIIHSETGKVLGVATYITHYGKLSWADEAAGKPETRWFGFRLDRIKDWEKVDWKTFIEQDKKMAEIQRFTDALVEFFNSGGSRYNQHETINVFYKKYFENALMRRHLSKKYYFYLKRFSEELLEVVFDDVKYMEKQFTYDYYKSALDRNLGIRRSAQTALEKMVEMSESRR